MSREEAIKEIIKVLEEAAENLCEEKVNIDIDTRPVGGMGGFDSLAGVSATFDCLAHFDLDDDDVQSIFVKKKHGKLCALTVGESADLLVDISNKKQRGKK